MWQQYWIYIKGQEDKDYFNLVDKVICPIIEDYKLDWVENLSRFFFFRYLHDGLHYIRFRVLADKETHDDIKSQLANDFLDGLISKYEIFDYDAQEDLQPRFGTYRWECVLNMCELASKLALNYASGKEVYDPHPQQVGGVAGIVHLIGNTLNYVVELEPEKKYNIKDWDRTQKRENNVP